MQWWCAAQNVTWSWTWTAYPGVWLFMLMIALAWFRARHRLRAASPGTAAPAPTALQNLAFATGFVLLWIVLDWPVGVLGAGYLASLHMIQFLVLALVAPPLLLAGWPRAAAGAVHAVRIVARPGHEAGAVPDGPGLSQDRAKSGEVSVRESWQAITHPVSALVCFTAIVIATHLPVTTDRLMPSQAGAFLIDTAWLFGGLLFWWPLLRPARAWFSRPLKIAYLFALMVMMTAPGAMITFSELPIYATYELAPPIPGINALEDQRLAGLGMRLGGSVVCWIAISILFLRWARDEEQLLHRELSPPA